MSYLAKRACEKLLFCLFPCTDKMMDICLDGIKEIAGTAETATFYIGLRHLLHTSVWGTIERAQKEGSSVGVDLSGLRQESLHWLVHDVARMGANPIVLEYSLFNEDQEMLRYIQAIKDEAERYNKPCPEVWLNTEREEVPSDLFDFAKDKFQGILINSNKFDTVRMLEKEGLSVIVSGFDGEGPNKFLHQGADRMIIGGFHREDCAKIDIMRRIHGVAGM